MEAQAVGTRNRGFLAGRRRNRHLHDHALARGVAHVLRRKRAELRVRLRRRDAARVHELPEPFPGKALLVVVAQLHAQRHHVVGGHALHLHLERLLRVARLHRTQQLAQRRAPLFHPRGFGIERRLLLPQLVGERRRIKRQKTLDIAHLKPQVA